MQNQGILRHHQRLIGIIQRLCDSAILFLSLISAMILHSGMALLTDQFYWTLAVVAACFFYLSARHLKLYRSFRFDGFFVPMQSVLLTWLVTVIALLLMGFIFKYTAYFSRIVLLTWVVITPIGLIMARLVIKSLLCRYRLFGRNSRHIVILGDSPQSQLLIKEIKDNPWMGIHVVGYFSPTKTGYDLSYLGNLDEGVKAIKAGNFDAVYIALTLTEATELESMVNQLSDASTPVYFLPDWFFLNLSEGAVSHIGEVTTVSVYTEPYDALGAFSKRIADVVISSAILLLISPIMILIAVAIKLTSTGPILYRQKRYGLGGDDITVFKFRSMILHEDNGQCKQAQKNDDRVTPIGRWLRNSSLDELPQFFNVLQGSMSIVGPRPHAIAHNEQYRQFIDGYMLRHLVKPGITGWAQVNGWRGETDTIEKMAKRIEFDLHYLNNWSLAFDLKIIALTIFTGFHHRNAY